MAAHGLMGFRLSRMNRKRKTAFHEAGHAVIGRVLMLPCGPASIKMRDSITVRARNDSSPNFGSGRVEAILGNTPVH